MTGVAFSSDVAFSRNLGLVSEVEQRRLGRACVAIPGVGGVGGWHALTLARQGVGAFHLADFDTFSVANMNRQAGAFMSTLGRPKVEVIRDMILDINPHARVRIWNDPISMHNIDEFLDETDLSLDGIDFFAVDARRLLFRKTRERGNWALTVGPLGFSAAFLAFAPDRGMTFDEYFDFREGGHAAGRLVDFAIGLAPRGLHTSYMDFGKVDFRQRCGPSSGLACQLCGSVAAMEAMSILLGWRLPDPAPAFRQLDLRRGVLLHGHTSFGNRHPLQRVKRTLFRRRLQRLGLLGP